MQDAELEKVVRNFVIAMVELTAVVGQYQRREITNNTPGKETKPQKEKPIAQETKPEPQPEETSGPTFKEVSNKYFALLDRIAEELSPEKAQANAIKLVNKYCGGEPISKDTLKPENFEPLLADIDKCNKAMDGRKK